MFKISKGFIAMNGRPHAGAWLVGGPFESL